MVTSFKRSHHALLHSVPQPYTAGHCQRTPLLIPGHSQATVGQSLMGSLLLSPGSWYAQGFVCALQESVSFVLFKFWQLYGGVKGYPSKRSYAIPRSIARRAPAPAVAHC